MGRLPFKVSMGDPVPVPAAPKRTLRDVGIVAGVFLTVVAGGLAYTLPSVPRTQVAAVVPTQLLDAMPVGSVGGSTISTISGSWDRDFAACAERLTRGGRFSKSSGIVRAKIRGRSTRRDRILLEPRMVACMAADKPGKFCNVPYREAFVEFARGSLVRAGAKARGPESFATLARPILRDSMRVLMRRGVVLPRDFMRLREWGAVPEFVREIAADMTIPRRPCSIMEVFRQND